MGTRITGRMTGQLRIRVAFVILFSLQRAFGRAAAAAAASIRWRCVQGTREEVTFVANDLFSLAK